MSTPARKKPRHGEHVPTTSNEAAKKSASPESLVGLLPPPPPATNSDDENTGPVTGSQPNTCATVTGRWTPEEDAELIIAVAKTKKRNWGKEYKQDWAAIANQVPGRTRVRCKVRWCNNLKHRFDGTTARTVKWTKDEDTKLKYAVVGRNYRVASGSNDKSVLG